MARQGHGVREITRALGLSRNTVRKYLRDDAAPCKAPRVERAHKLDPYKPYLIARINAAKPHRLPATVLMNEIKVQGYHGGLTRLRMFLLEQYLSERKPDPLVRFETPAGQQMQVDWIVFRRGVNPLSAFVATLGHSRASFVEFVCDEKLETLLRCHEAAFDYFGGVAREVLYDNMKTVVLERNAYGEGQHRFHPTFLDFAQHHGFTPRLCKPYRAKTKGKVERFNGYLRRSFYNPLASRLAMSGVLLDATTANAEVRSWLAETANARTHGTTGKVPAQELVLECSALQPIAGYWRGVIPGVKTPTARHHDESAFGLSPLESYDACAFQHRLETYNELCGEHA